MLLANINKTFGIKFFKNPNTLNYNLFNFFFRKNIVDINDNLIRTYHELGYLKPKVNSKDLANFLSDKIKSSKFKKLNAHSNRIEIDDEMKGKIKHHINYDYNEVIQALKRYYKSDIAILNIHIKRNYGKITLCGSCGYDYTSINTNLGCKKLKNHVFKEILI